MSKRSAAYQKWRPLLTDTLPYEVPLIFTNDFLFASVAEGSSDTTVSNTLENLRRPRRSFGISYSYGITKDRYNSTTLSVIHPIYQMRMALFYDSYAETITQSCGLSDFSIRYPAEPTPLRSQFDLEKDPTVKDGIPHVDPEEGELDASRVSSYFTYRGYSLLSRFIDSPEYIRLEKRYSYLRVLDISKCFFHIYTHSISWAVKGKTAAKENRLRHSFEAAFDTLMQDTNYGETNGIVVGPESSRIFAEIILQATDRAVAADLSKVHQLHHNREYAIRRYVDDYYVFADSNDTLDIVQSELSRQLEKFKLFLNQEKIHTYQRPFVTKITLARRDAQDVIRTLFDQCSGLAAVEDPDEYRRRSRQVLNKIGDLRMVVGEYGVGFHTLSGWLLGSLRALLGNIVRMSNEPASEARLTGLTDTTVRLFELISYVVALDLRVRTTYSFAQVALIADNFAKGVEGDHRDRVRHSIHQEFAGLVQAATSAFQRDSRRADSVELYNLLIASVFIVGPSILEDAAIAEAITAIKEKDEITYFQFVTLKFCYLQRHLSDDPDIQELDDRALERLEEATPALLTEHSELYLLFCDFLSSPNVTTTKMRELLKNTIGGNWSNAQLEELRRHTAFVDWSGMRLEHYIQRKQLRPVYSAS